VARLKVGVLISGRGSNMAALIDAARAPDYPAEIACVVSNRAAAEGLATARAAGIPTEIVALSAHADRAAADRAMTAVLARHGVQLVALAGFMRILSSDFPAHWAGRIVNIHPSLLPAFKGLGVQRQAIEAGARVSGCTVHFVTAELDAGPIVAQAAVPVLAGDTPATLAARILRQEHRLYPLAIRWIAERRVRIEGGRTLVDGVPPGATLLFSPDA